MSHIKTAHQYGVTQALEKCGYASLEAVQRDLESLGIVKKADNESTKKTSPLDALVRK